MYKHVPLCVCVYIYILRMNQKKANSITISLASKYLGASQFISLVIAAPQQVPH